MKTYLEPISGNLYYCNDYKSHNSIKFNNEYRGLYIIDEPIAIPVSILCKKGYTTRYCCAGHLGDNGIDCSEIIPEDARAYIQFEPFVNIPFDNIKLPDGWNIMITDGPLTIEFIYFKEAHKHDYENDKLYSEIMSVGIFMHSYFYHYQLEVMDNLTKWVLSLPDMPITFYDDLY